MARYNLMFMVDGGRIDTIKKKMAEVFPDAECVVEKNTPATSRAARLGEAEGQFEDAKGTVEELKDEMEQWLESIPENLTGGTKAEEVQAAVDALEEIFSNMEQIEFSVEFPGLY